MKLFKLFSQDVLKFFHKYEVIHPHNRSCYSYVYQISFEFLKFDRPFSHDLLKWVPKFSHNSLSKLLCRKLISNHIYFLHQNLKILLLLNIESNMVFILKNMTERNLFESCSFSFMGYFSNKIFMLILQHNLGDFQNLIFAGCLFGKGLTHCVSQINLLYVSQSTDFKGQDQEAADLSCCSSEGAVLTSDQRILSASSFRFEIKATKLRQRYPYSASLSAVEGVRSFAGEDLASGQTPYIFCRGFYFW